MIPSLLRRPWGLPLRDVVLSLALAVASTGAIVSGEVDEGPRWLTLSVALVSAAAVTVRTRWPLQGATVVALAGLAQALVGAESPGTLMALVAALVLVYTVGSECGEGAASIGLIALAS